MPIQTFAPAQRQQFGQSFTPQISQSGIVQALLSGEGQQQPQTPIEGVGQVAQQLAGAVITRKEEERRKKEQEDFQARIAELLAPSTLLPGAAGLEPVVSQDLAPLPEQGLNRQDVTERIAGFRSRFGGIR